MVTYIFVSAASLIEQLTGQPTEQVLQELHDHGIPVRTFGPPCRGYDGTAGLITRTKLRPYRVAHIFSIRRSSDERLLATGWPRPPVVVCHDPHQSRGGTFRVDDATAEHDQLDAARRLHRTNAVPFI